MLENNVDESLKSMIRVRLSIVEMFRFQYRIDYFHFLPYLVQNFAEDRDKTTL